MTVTGNSVAGSPVVESSTAGPSHPSPEEVDPGTQTTRARRWRTLLIAASAYLVLSMISWSNVWLHHPTSTTTCGCGDSSLFTWFLEWPAYAMSHGLNPFYSTAMFYPKGVNLLANTSELAVGVVLAPVTWIFGPIATFNVALTLSPALSALAMFILLRRWVSWAPAAFVGGLFYGFSPFILVSISEAHLMVGMAIVPPLIVAMVDELLVRQRGRPIVAGILLGLLMALQFFIGTETLAITVFAGVLCVVSVAAYAAWRNPSALARHARFAVAGFAAAGITAIALLAYPTWFALAGPAHYSGPIWLGFNLSHEAARIGDFLVSPPAPKGLFSAAYNHAVGGYQGPILSSQYFGIGVAAVLIGGVVAWRRDRRLWLFGGAAFFSALLSLGVASGYWTPWQLLIDLPLFQDIIPNRFLIITYLAVAVMLGLIIDHVYVCAVRRARSGGDGATGQGSERPWSRHPRWTGAAAGVIVAGIAVVPTFAYLAQGLPFTVRPVVLPTWFRTVAPHLTGNQVLLVFPVPFATIESTMTWQAVDRMHYSMVGGGGPGDLLARAGKERNGQAVIANVSYSFGLRNTITTDRIAAVHQALIEWGVDMVVIPDQPQLPTYDQPQSVTLAAALITAATGSGPIHQADAWVWTGVSHKSPSAFPSTASFSRCTAGVPDRGVAAVDRATTCVLAASASGPSS